MAVVLRYLAYICYGNKLFTLYVVALIEKELRCFSAQS